jgi:hypothetical protein
MFNGNGFGMPVVRAKSLAHTTTLSPGQLAVQAANVLDGRAPYQPTQLSLAKEFGVSVPMIELARQLSPAARDLVMNGMPIAYFRQRFIADRAAFAMVRAIGVDRMLDIAAAVEAAE